MGEQLLDVKNMVVASRAVRSSWTVFSVHSLFIFSPEFFIIFNSNLRFLSLSPLPSPPLTILSSGKFSAFFRCTPTEAKFEPLSFVGQVLVFVFSGLDQAAARNILVMKAVKRMI